MDPIGRRVRYRAFRTDSRIVNFHDEIELFEEDGRTLGGDGLRRSQP